MSILMAIGSFATVLSALWLLATLLLAAIYPLVRTVLLRWHPATGSIILLLLLAFPLLLSLATTIMLFIPDVEVALVQEHCHTECGEHFPLLTSAYASAAGLVLLAMLVARVTGKLLQNLQLSRTMMSQLLPLAVADGPWQLLPQQERLVFTLGWWKSRIFLTQGLLEECGSEELDIILEHEKEHARRHDNIRLLLAKLFMLPLPAAAEYKLYTDLHLLTESACDFAAARTHDNLDVAAALLRIQRLVPQQFEFSRYKLGTAFTGAEISDRIRLLVSGRAISRFHYLAPWFCLTVLIALSITLVDPIHHNVESLLGDEETQL